MKLSDLEKYAKNSLSFLDNEYVSTFIKVVLTVYAAVIAPKLPGQLAGLFNNNLFKLFVFVLVAWVATKDKTISLLIALTFLLSMTALRGVNVMSLVNNLENQEEEVVVTADETETETEPEPEPEPEQVDESDPQTEVAQLLGDDTVVPNDELPGFGNEDNQGRLDQTENFAETSVEAPLHPDHLHNGAQGLQTDEQEGGMTGYDSYSIGSWATY